MGNRLSKIVTRTGDDGKSHLGDGVRIYKNHPRLEAIGTIDELNSFIGFVLSFDIKNTEIKQALQQIQHHLFDLGGELCPPYRSVITEEHVVYLENLCQEWNQSLPPLKEFILPGGTTEAASAHLARSLCRRAERTIVALHQEQDTSHFILQYINRLSDLLFIAARCLNQTRAREILWEHERKK